TFNIRFNDTWDAQTIQAEIHNRLDQAAGRKKYRPGKKTPVDYELVWRDRPSHVFLTRDDRLIDTLSSSVKTVVGRTPALSTSGGTSDARFIKDYCPVVEFGLVGKSMHMVDERVALADLETLTQIYERFIEDWFAKGLS
ncbi:MAG: M20/M25/M40 family metallo-hydrolase, partial [Mesorhizobium sp.]